MLERAIVGGRGDARQQGIALRRGGAATLDLLAHELLRMLLAAVGGRLVAIDQHHVDAGERRHIGDAGAHEAGADDADGLEPRRRHLRGPAGALVELLHRDEQRADHGSRLRRAQDLREPARLHAQRQIHRQLQPFIDGLQDGARGRIVVVGLAPVDRIGGWERHHAGLGIDRAARQPEIFPVPWRLGGAAGLDPILGALDQVGRGHDRIDELQALGLRDPELIALEQKLQRIRRLEQPRHSLGAAGAGEQPDLHLGQADARLLGVGGDAVVAGEAKLKTAAQHRAVDGGDPRLAAGLNPPVEQRELAALLEEPGSRSLFAARRRHIGKLAAGGFQHGEIGTGAERFLARGDDDAPDGSISHHRVEDRAELGHDREIDHVHGAAWTVPGDERNAIGIGCGLEVDVGHEVSRLAHGACASARIGLAGFVGIAEAVLVLVGAQVDVRIFRLLARGAGADLEKDRV